MMSCFETKDTDMRETEGERAPTYNDDHMAQLYICGVWGRLHQQSFQMPEEGCWKPKPSS